LITGAQIADRYDPDIGDLFRAIYKDEEKHLDSLQSILMRSDPFAEPEESRKPEVR